MRLISFIIGLFMGVFPILGFAFGFAEGRDRHPITDCGLSHGRTP